MFKGRDGERGRVVFFLFKEEIENALFSSAVMKSCVERILAGKTSRHAVKL